MDLDGLLLHKKFLFLIWYNVRAPLFIFCVKYCIFRSYLFKVPLSKVKSVFNAQEQRGTCSCFVFGRHRANIFHDDAKK